MNNILCKMTSGGPRLAFDNLKSHLTRWAWKCIILLFQSVCLSCFSLPLWIFYLDVH